MTAKERAEKFHEIYLATAKRLGWVVRPECDVPFDKLSKDAQELDYALARYTESQILEAENAVWEKAAEIAGEIAKEQVCNCHEDYTGRGRHESNAAHFEREEVADKIAAKLREQVKK